MPWAEIANTTTGNDVPKAQIPANGSLTFQVTGNGGMAARDDAGTRSVTSAAA